MGKAGRPFGTLKYDNIEDLEAGIDKYFKDCDETHKPPTLEDLALSLNISIKTLWNYGQEGYACKGKDDKDNEGSNQYLHAIQRAREKCISYASSRLYDKEGSNGAKFYLTNNSERMGGLKYAERQEVSMDVAPITFVDDLGD